MTILTNKTGGNRVFAIGAATVFGAGLLLGAQSADAGSLASIQQAANILTSDAITMGAAVTVDAGGPVAIGPGVELPFFAFGTYDVDATANSLTMTFVNDPANLLVTEYDDTIVDQYYFEFDKQITSASLASFTPGFAATVELVAPGTSVSGADGFDLGVPTSFTFGNGGILISIGEGTDLNDVAAANGSLTIEMSAVPLPAALPLFLVGFAGFGLIRARKKTG